ncbi:MAG: DEAD/DEAH box helicase family protein [Lentilactobacillus hilgardii]|uniref:DEAD/DEAH box helicase n=3 Tax=Lentilactobacillus hilgardii TaxID=1588 RepID=UPI001CC1CC2F|nr:DEAD/DEAH box helicase [Lentilactobacillus hilgardii]MBZ2199816.1 restriction endonuclease subunit R [Lentilactobacillus hilgardii]MBZ2203690.1 restriction endonuclease subunit R [Lentilactobacillus hilgardii]
MIEKFQTFKMNGLLYELVTVGRDFSKPDRGKVAIFRQQNSDSYGVMPLTELNQYLVDNGKSQKMLQKRLALYKKRFVGRTDVYAHRYYNKKSAKDMYAPVVPFKDGRPQTDHWMPLTDDDLKMHLIGQQFLGFYPMFPDNTTKYLVIDIDGHHEGDKWQEITNSIRKICQKRNIPTLIELSQSGRGCHVWFFFREPVNAVLARLLGDALLKATMAVNPNLSFTAFDRLFPSQDIIGEKKIGNLIAGPLQGTRRQEGKSVFVDENFHPLKDQWKALGDVELLTEERIKSLTNELNSQSSFYLFDENEDQTDLLKEPLRINQVLTIIRSNGLYIRKSELNQHQLTQLKWLASFRNPKFYEKQRLRLSTFNEPRIINVFDETDQFLVLPRGIEDELAGIIPHTKWTDKVTPGRKIHARFNGKLRSDQETALASLISHRSGILAARTGFGKTVIAARIIAELGVSTLILVHDKELADQWIERLNQFLKITDQPFLTEHTPTGRKRRKKVIGTYFGTKHNRSGIVDVATIQSFKPNQDSREILNQYGLVISDEVHHDAAYTYEQIIKQLHCKYLFGLSATPFRRDGQEPIITMRFGPIRYQTAPIDETTLLKVKRLVIPRFTSLGITNLQIANNGINQNYEAILNDEDRNQSILEDIKTVLLEERHVLVLTNRIEHLQRLALALEVKRPVFLLYGQQTERQNRQIVEKINQVMGSYVVIATGKYAGEGLDIGTIDTLILAMPHSWKGSSEQYLGRMQRNLSQKSEIRVYDYVDMFVPMLAKMYRKRQKTYEYLHYQTVNDNRSQQAGIKFFNGHYQNNVLESVHDAKKILICANRLSDFLMKKVLEAVNNQSQIQILTNEMTSYQKGQLNYRKISYSFYDQNLPTCLVIDEKQLWLSSDIGFKNDTGITVQMNQPQLAKQFIKMLIHSIDRLDL